MTNIPHMIDVDRGLVLTSRDVRLSGKQLLAEVGDPPIFNHRRT